MSVEFNIKQVAELIKRDYRVPVFAEITIDADQSVIKSPQHISMKDVLTPLLKDYEIAKRREEYLIKLVEYFTDFGCTFPYLDNLKKQNFMNSVADAIPDVKWKVWFKDTATYGKDQP